MTSLRCLFSCRTYTVESGVYTVESGVHTLEQGMFNKVYAYNLSRMTSGYAYFLSPLRMAVL